MILLLVSGERARLEGYSQHLVEDLWRSSSDRLKDERALDAHEVREEGSLIIADPWHPSFLTSLGMCHTFALSNSS